MLLHIGGSAKRQSIGKDLGITNPTNILLSPSGRKLIGKIGIGIFSVAQLTQTFQIITKTKGDNFRTVATVAMKQYSDESLGPNTENGYESGKVNIWREEAKDIDSHGTTIVLTSIKPQAADTLRSQEVWTAIEQSGNSLVVDDLQTITTPKYHVGVVDSTSASFQDIYGKLTNVPWESTDTPDVAFQKLVQCVWDEILYSNPNPQLDKIFDYYLQMIWQISLSIPLKYVDGHLFDMDLTGWSESFLISNKPKGAAQELILTEGLTIKDTLNLKGGNDTLKFDVFIDELKLFRPIKFKGLPNSGHAIKHPLIFIGKCREEFNSYSTDLSGGPLEFEAYLFWTPKVVPTEHRGSLIRINGASGTLFDPSFMRYQVSEQTRLRQITCEIFIYQGFDSALNIDRESFNYSHPHAVYLTRWLHSALRQLATTQKRIANSIRTKSRSDTKDQSLSEIQKIVIETWHEESKDMESSPPSIEIEDSDSQMSILPNSADIVFDRSAIIDSSESIKTSKTINEIQILDEKIKAIAQILTSFSLLDNLSKHKQEKLLKAIYRILETSK